MNVIEVTVMIRVPDSSPVTQEEVAEAVTEACQHMEQYDDQSLFNWHEYEVE